MSITIPLFRSLAEGDDHDQHDHGDDGHEAWGQAMLGALFVFLVTFSGVFLAAAAHGFTRVRALPKSLTHLSIPSFASGALLATSIFLLIPESIELLSAGGKVGEGEHRNLAEEDHHDDDHSYVWKVGTAFMSGFVLPLILHAFFPTSAELVEEIEAQEEQDNKHLGVVVVPQFADKANSKKESDDDNKDEESSGEDDHEDFTFPGECETGECCHQDKQECGKPPKDHKWPLVMSIMISDFFCNFADGIFIGTAFMLCTKSVAYAIVASTVYHEVAQEIADFVLLTHTCKFSIQHALLLNSLQGSAVFLGVIIILAAEPSQTVIGALLAFSSGVFMHITAVECIPKIQSQLHASARKNTLIFLLCFAVGAVPIGLVLLNHGHCEAASHEDNH